jgi:hypothetical protein
MKSFLVSTIGFPDSLIWSETRSRAFWACVRSYCECFDCKPRRAFDVLKIKRAPGYDHIKKKADTMIEKTIVDKESG